MNFAKLTAAALVGVVTFGAGEAAIAEYPEKPIRLIIPYRAGGGSDGLARTIQKAIETHKLMSVPLVISNVDGAGGAVGARRVKDAKPDGYTFLQMHNGMFASAATGVLGFGPDAYEPVAQTTQSCIYLAVPGNKPWNTYEEFVTAAKADSKFKAADSIGGITHFAWLQLMRAGGFEIGMVQAGGTAKRFASIKGGHTEAALMSPGWIARAGDELRGLLWLGPTRHPAAPDMRTAQEIGVDVSACLNRRFWAPKGTPQVAIDHLAGVLGKVMQTPELKEYHAKRLSGIVFRTGSDLKADIDKEMAGYREVAPIVKAAMGIK